jgi:3-carboxy-cis,cis-muconate cycloisomerase
MSEALLDPLFTTDAMRAVFDDHARVQGMLDFEAALARAEARLGIVPAAAAFVIASACQAALYDFAELGTSTRLAGNPAIPLVKALTAEVARRDAEAARWVHRGATSQDVIDTGLVLQLREALRLLDDAQIRLARALEALARAHRLTVMPGRTLLQHAVPVTLGLKAAGWLAAVQRSRTRLRELVPRVLKLQFGGAAGTLAALGARGPDVAALLAEELQLAFPDLPWHTQRDTIAECGAAVGLLGGSLGKLARDIALLMQSEVAEVFEPAGHDRGGSSAMPHKRNPVGSVVAQAAAARVPNLVATLFAVLPQEHERAIGGWHAEWETLPAIFRLVAGSLAHVTEIVEGLEVDVARMRANLDATLGVSFAESVTMALGAKIDRAKARQLVEAASKRAIVEQRHLRDVLRDDAEIAGHLSEAEFVALFDPQNALGASAAMIDRVLAANQE